MSWNDVPLADGWWPNNVCWQYWLVFLIVVEFVFCGDHASNLNEIMRTAQGIFSLCKSKIYKNSIQITFIYFWINNAIVLPPPPTHTHLISNNFIKKNGINNWRVGASMVKLNKRCYKD